MCREYAEIVDDLHGISKMATPTHANTLWALGWTTSIQEVVLDTGLIHEIPVFVLQSSKDQGFGWVNVKKRSPEFDSKVLWEAYRVRFELLADKNGWNGSQRAIQFATGLKSAALELLSQSLVEDRSSYFSYSWSLTEKITIMYTCET